MALIARTVILLFALAFSAGAWSAEKDASAGAGKPAGEIEDLVVNLGTGRVKEVVLAQDGRKGPEPKQTLPLSAFVMPAERGGEVVLKSR